VSFIALGDETGASNAAKLSVLQSVFVPILTYGHESYVMTEGIPSEVQAAEEYLRRVKGVTVRDKVRSCDIRKTLNVEPFLWIERSQLRWFVQNVPGKSSEASATG